MITKKSAIIFLIATIFLILFLIFSSIGGLSLFTKSFLSWFITMAIITLAVLGFSFYIIKYKDNKVLLQILDMLSFLAFSITTVVFVLMFFLLPARIEKNSMSPTVKDGDRVLVYHFFYKPKVKDIIIVEITKDNYQNVDDYAFIDSNGNEASEIYFIKRIVAKPGDTIEFVSFSDHFQMKVNGVVANHNDEIYQIINPTTIISYLDSNGKLKKDEYLIFGDNDFFSEDSRSIGTIKERDIKGKVIFGLSPFGVIK